MHDNYLNQKNPLHILIVGLGAPVLTVSQLREADFIYHKDYDFILKARSDHMTDGPVTITLTGDALEADIIQMSLALRRRRLAESRADATLVVE